MQSQVSKCSVQQSTWVINLTDGDSLGTWYSIIVSAATTMIRTGTVPLDATSLTPETSPGEHKTLGKYDDNLHTVEISLHLQFYYQSVFKSCQLSHSYP